MVKLSIFSDFHHQGLYASFHYLFENRLGHELYRPIGKEWFDKGFWKIAEPYNNYPGTIEQYLGDRDFVPSDGSPSLNIPAGFCCVLDTTHHFKQKVLTFEEFCNTDIDIIIATIPAHVPTYKRLIKEYKPTAKLIYHIGNIGWHESVPSEAENIMASVKEFKTDKNAVFYRQEFDLNVFKPLEGPLRHANVTSFVNCLPQPETYLKLKEKLTEFEFKAYGIGCPDGTLGEIDDIARAMQRSTFGYHNKPHGDGFGHVIHNWMAVGKPVIVNLGDYKDKLAGELLIEGETCIDLDKGIDHVVEIVRRLSSLEYADMSNKVQTKFKEVVDFGRDADKVRNFLDRLV